MSRKASSGPGVNALPIPGLHACRSPPSLVHRNDACVKPLISNLILERGCGMRTIRIGDQVVSMAPDGEAIDVCMVVKVLSDGVQLDGSSEKISKPGLRWYREEIVNQIREKEVELKAIKREIRSLYDGLD